MQVYAVIIAVNAACCFQKGEGVDDCIIQADALSIVTVVVRLWKKQKDPISQAWNVGPGVILRRRLLVPLRLCT